MTLNEYQQKAMQTCTLSSENFSYMTLNLVGEVGEFSSKIAKGIRKEEINIEWNNIEMKSSVDIRAIHHELGDMLWQLSGLCSVLGVSLEEIAQMNLDKLAGREERGTIIGDGDNR